ncbi:MAG TPA: dual specificity protein phosphatase family protein [Candidatus Saccharimonadales bacterium]|nr:dual specificity protein phosphatase family protein [Candidatus Saccharimonadales bacterium]
MNYDYYLFDSLINLDTFSRLESKTDIYKSDQGYFVPIKCRIFNFHTPLTLEVLDHDIHNYFNFLKTLIPQLSDYKIKLLCQYFTLAYNNGLINLLNTYKSTLIYDSLYQSIHDFKTVMDENDKIDIICPAEHFTNDDWHYMMAICHKLQYESTSLYKYYLQYSGTLIYNQVATQLHLYHWYDLITSINDVNIYLGAMPVTTFIKNDLMDFKKINIGAVLSVVECFENHSCGLITSPILPHEWNQHDILYFQLPICDFQNIPLDKIDIGVEYIKWIITHHRRDIYISCRVGKQRSTLVLMAFLIKYQNKTADDIFDFIKLQRPQVKNDHVNLLRQYEALLKK